MIVLFLPLVVLSLQKRTETTSHAQSIATTGISIYVNGSTGNDNNSGAQNSPVKTIQKGVTLANSILNSNQDATVFIAAGTYREAVVFGNSSNTTNFMTLQADPGTILSGSDPWNSGWTQQPDGIYVHSWSNKWGMKAISSGWEGYWDSDGKGYIRDRMRRYESLFVDDQPLFNRLNLSELSLPGTFYVDEINNKIYVHPYNTSSFTSSTIEVGMRQMLVSINGRHNIIIKNLQVEKSKGALQDTMFEVNNSSDITLEGVVVRLAAYTGFGSASSQRVTVRNTKFVDNGVNGAGSFHNIDNILEDSLVARNNWRGFDAAHQGWDSVFKWSGTRNGKITRTDFIDNWGSGLWLDWDNANTLIDQVFSARNKGTGYWIEADTGPVTIQNSISCQNNTGVQTAYSNGLRLYTNKIFSNTVSQINWGGEDKLLDLVQWDTNQTVTLKSGDHIWTGNTVLATDANSKLITGPTGTTYLNGWRLSYKGDMNTWFSPTSSLVFNVGNNTDGKATLIDFYTWRTNNANYSGNINKNNEANSQWLSPGTLFCLKPGASTDTTSPTVEVVAPTNNSTISGIIPVSALASDETAVSGVQFKVDGTNIGVESVAKPYTASWNSNSVTNGTHSLTAIARDAAGNTKVSSPITVTVNNMTTATTYRDLVLKDAPAGYWRFEETAGTTAQDDSGNGKIGLINNGATLNNPGLLANSTSSIGFDGINDFVSLGLVHSSSSDDAWTWELWANIESVSTNNSGLLGTGNNPRFTAEPNRTIVFSTAFRDGSWAGGPTTAAINTGSHHLVATVTGATSASPVAKIYIDGIQAATYTYPRAINSPWSRGTEGSLRINMRDSVFGVKGVYDEAAAYDYALSGTQIKAHYDLGRGILPTPTATPQPTTTPLPTTITKQGDYNNDGKVDLLDFNLWRDEFSGTLTTKRSDQNTDGQVDLLDFNRWLTAFEAT